MSEPGDSVTGRGSARSLRSTACGSLTEAFRNVWELHEELVGKIREAILMHFELRG
jgi:hypothetical protein